MVVVKTVLVPVYDDKGLTLGDMSVEMSIQCSTCAHLDLEKNFSCAAFPEGIPDAILKEGFDHTKEFSGDDGIRYKLMEGVAVTLKEKPESVVVTIPKKFKVDGK